MDVIAAGLAEADNLIALAGTGLKIAGDAMQGHWGDALMGAGMLGATYLGGKAFEKLGGKLIEKDRSPRQQPCVRRRRPCGCRLRKHAYGGSRRDLAGHPASGPAACLFLGPPLWPLVRRWLVFDPRRPGLRQRSRDPLRRRRLPGTAFPDPCTRPGGIDTGRVWRGTGDGGFLSATFHYDDENQASTVVDSLGRRIVYRYDENGNLTSITDPLGNTLTTLHDRYGRLISGTDALGRTTTREYDEFGNTTRITRPDGTEITGVFVAAAKPVEVCLPDGTKWRYRYDDRGQLTAVIDPAEAVTRYQYDDRGGIREIVEPLGAVKRITTDGTGLPVLIEESDGGTTRIGRDAFGRIVSVTQPDGVTVTAGWSVEGLSLWEAGPDGVVATRAYDAEHVNGRTVGFAYDAADRRIHRTTPSGAQSAWDYDGAADHARLTTASGTLDFAFDALGRETGRAFGADLRLTQVFDADGWLTEQQLWRGGTPTAVVQPTQLLMERAYSYRADNTPVRISDSLRGTREYGLDRLGRDVAVQAATWNESYAYDEFGNVAHAAVPGGPDSGDPVVLPKLGYRL